MEEFELKMKISVSDKEFKKLVGPIVYQKIVSDTFKRDNHTCQGCKYHPLDESLASKALSCHVVEINQEMPEESECQTLCLACHSIQHIDVAIEKGWVQLVNSTFSQKSLVEMCRVNAVFNSIKDDNTRFLKTPAKVFLEEFKNNIINKNIKTKVIFTTNFEWGDL